MGLKTKISALSIALLMLVGCGDTENEYSSTSIYLAIDNATHKDATLASAMNQNAPGVFCSVRLTMRSGARYFSFANNQGLSSESIFNGIDQRLSFVVGQNNGIIVGFGNLDNPATFYAYDLECPNCFSADAIPVKSYPLTMDENGLATCSACVRKYNLNTGGNIVSGTQGSKLTRYHASTTDPLGVLAVH